MIADFYFEVIIFLTYNFEWRKRIFFAYQPIILAIVLVGFMRKDWGMVLGMVQ